MYALRKLITIFAVVISLLMTVISCGNRMSLKSVGMIDLDSLVVEVEPLVILTMYQNDILPAKYQELYASVKNEMASQANVAWLLLDEVLPMDQATINNVLAEKISQEIDNSYDIAWETIQCIVKNKVLRDEFRMGDVDDKYAPEFIEYYFNTIADVEARIALSEPLLIKDEKDYATFTVVNTLTNITYLIKLTPKSDTEYYIEVSEL